MKTITRTLAMLLFAGAITNNVTAQECKDALTFTQGAEFEMKTYNEKDKQQSSAKYKVLSVSGSGGNVEAKVQSEAFDEKNKSVGTNTYGVKCENGAYMVDMKMMMNAEQMKGFEGMEVKVEADYLEVPATLTPGTTLKDGKITMVVNPAGPLPMNNHIYITNRKVEKTESITTPAGTFECVKMTYDVETKIGFKITTKVEEWYAKGVGTILTKNYNSKGKLMSYSQLTSMKK